ncbi:MAG: Dabb family protein [Campylobacterales bacterium]|nr:Dabb family protein [Campylobacterales bacterium]
MIVHIVFFKLKDTNKNANISQIKSMLEGLSSKIDVIRFLEVGVNLSQEERAMDMSLITHFDTKEALLTYANHPDHLEVVGVIKEVSEYTKVVDYEKL